MNCRTQEIRNHPKSIQIMITTHAEHIS